MKKVFVLVLGVVVVAVAATVWKGNFINKQRTEPTLKAELVSLSGSVEYRQGTGEWKRATANTTLHESDAVEILGTGQAVILIDDGSAIRLDSNSGVTLQSLDPKNIVIVNNKGRVYSRVTKLDRTFFVKSGTVSYESLGTAFQTINTDKEQGVVVFESKVKIIGSGENEILVEAGKKYFIVNTANKTIEKKLVKVEPKEIKDDEFTMWNKEEDEKDDDFKNDLGVLSDDSLLAVAPATPIKATEDTVTAPTTGITLNGTATTEGIKFTWKVNGVSAPNGFKLVRSSVINPVYPGNEYIYLTDKDVRSYKWEIKDGQTYYFRVCQYLGGKCGVYSNNVKIKAPLKTESSDDDNSNDDSSDSSDDNSADDSSSDDSSSDDNNQAVNSINITNLGNGNMSWVVNGESKFGFKLVWSKKSGPTYPLRDGDQYQYYNEAGTRNGTINAFNGEGIYYVRVCEYLGGKCGIYSNQIQVSL